MSFTTTCADNLRIAIADLEGLTHQRTKESFDKLRLSVLTRMKQTADLLEGDFELNTPEPAKPAPKPSARRKRRTTEIADRTNVIDFRARADAVFKK